VARSAQAPFVRLKETSSVRVLLVEDDTMAALAIHRELSGHFDLRPVASLAEALGVLDQGAWRPDVVLANPSLPDSQGVATLQSLQAAAPGTPVVVSTGTVSEALRRQLEALSAAATHDRPSAPAAHRAAFVHQGASHSLMAYRIETIAEIDRVTRDAAVSRAIDELLDRLGLGDEEGLRMAIRLARGWEAAKSRFVSAVTTGLASALLLALGAGIVAMMRHGGSK
jgi:CheY-like chemotaxis protein